MNNDLNNPNGQNSFNSLDTSMRKNSVIQERINLVSTYMYQQFLEYQHATRNTSDIFLKMMENMGSTVEFVKQSFLARGVTAQNIYCETDNSQQVAVLNIVWHPISFTTRCNPYPQGLHRDKETPLITGRIIALRGIYSDVIKKNPDNEMQALLESEVASLYVPADQTQNAVIKIKHLGSREFYVNQTDAPYEFLLKVIEIVCGGGIMHEEYRKKLL